MSVDEYLRTSFEDADRELVDGEVVERPTGDLTHGRAEGELICLLHERAAETGIQVLPVIRIRTSPTRFRVADIGVWRAGDIGQKIPTAPPFLVVEILSPEDRLVRIQEKVQEYLAIGTDHVWVIDPEERRAIVYSQQAPAGRVEEVLRTHNPDIEIPLLSVLPA
jgi:Uma2 family endonuclease